MGPSLIPVDKQKPVWPAGVLCASEINTQGMDWTHRVETPLQSVGRLWIKGGDLQVRGKGHLRGRLSQECGVQCQTKRPWVLDKKGGIQCTMHGSQKPYKRR